MESRTGRAQKSVIGGRFEELIEIVQYRARIHLPSEITHSQHSSLVS